MQRMANAIPGQRLEHLELSLPPCHPGQRAGLAPLALIPGSCFWKSILLRRSAGPGHASWLLSDRHSPDVVGRAQVEPGRQITCAHTICCLLSHRAPPRVGDPHGASLYPHPTPASLREEGGEAPPVGQSSAGWRGTGWCQGTTPSMATSCCKSQRTGTLDAWFPENSLKTQSSVPSLHISPFSVGQFYWFLLRDSLTLNNF